MKTSLILQAFACTLLFAHGCGHGTNTKLAIDLAMGKQASPAVLIQSTTFDDARKSPDRQNLIPLRVTRGMLIWQDLVAHQEHKTVFGTERGVYAQSKFAALGDGVIFLTTLVPLYVEDVGADGRHKFQLRINSSHGLVGANSWEGHGSDEFQFKLAWYQDIHEGTVIGYGARGNRVYPGKDNTGTLVYDDSRGGSIVLTYKAIGSGNSVYVLLQRIDCPKGFVFGVTEGGKRYDIAKLAPGSYIEFWDASTAAGAALDHFHRNMTAVGGVTRASAPPAPKTIPSEPTAGKSPAPPK